MKSSELGFTIKKRQRWTWLLWPCSPYCPYLVFWRGYQLIFHFIPLLVFGLWVWIFFINLRIKARFTFSLKKASLHVQKVGLDIRRGQLV